MSCSRTQHTASGDAGTGFIQGSLSKIQVLFKDFSRLFTVFKDLKFRKNIDRSVKILLHKC